MTLFPIVERELRVAARRRSTYWLRFAVALVALVVGLAMYGEASGIALNRVGDAIFHGLAKLAAVMCLLGGILLTSHSLSTEKEEGTLGLLFLTNLRGIDIVLGKLAANSTNGLFAVLAVIPVLGLSLLLGGVSVGDLGRVALALINLLFFSLSVGLLASTFCRSNRLAVGLTILINLIMGVIFPVVGLWLADADVDELPLIKLGIGPKMIVASGMAWSSPMAPVIAFITKQKAGLWPWFSLLLMHCCTWLFLMIAAWHLPRSWQEKRPTHATSAWRQRWRVLWQGTPEWRQTLRARQLARSPILWLAARQHWKRTWVWAYLAVCLGLWYLGSVTWPKFWLDPICFFICAFLMGTVLKLWIALEAPHLFATERRQGRLELLLLTPLDIREIVRGQQLALIRQFGGPLLCLLALDAISAGVMMKGGDSKLLLATLAGILALVLDIIALPWLGMWMGVAARRLSPGFWTVFYIMGLPWLAMLGLSIGGQIAHDTVKAINGPCIGHWFSDEDVMLFVWTVSSIAVAGGFWVLGRHRLLNHFRTTAARVRC